jgi:hypothetical protein
MIRKAALFFDPEAQFCDRLRFGVVHVGALIRVRNLGLDGRKTAMRIALLPRALRRLKPLEVEDVLCIFKYRFRATVRGVRRSWCG